MWYSSLFRPSGRGSQNPDDLGGNDPESGHGSSSEGQPGASPREPGAG